jgi:hypothetical protein
MKFETELTLQPLESTYKGAPYYEQVLILEGTYAVALVHQDLFWPGGRKNLPSDQFDIHDALSEGTTLLKVKVTFETIDE